MQPVRYRLWKVWEGTWRTGTGLGFCKAPWMTPPGLGVTSFLEVSHAPGWGSNPKGADGNIGFTQPRGLKKHG